MTVHTLIEACLAQGLSLEAIAEATQTMLSERRTGTSRWGSSTATGDTKTIAFQEVLLDEPGEELHARSAPPGTDASTGVPGLPRYEDIGLLGMGGMGEVRRVRDRRLGRTVALKIMHAALLDRPALAARFLEEAQATAQLQHPGIVPIYDLGELPDGRLWFTLKEVTGRTFGAVIEAVHAVSRRRWQSTADGWSLHRLVSALHQVCDAVAYAHGRGVVHRDLKPANVMVGVHGEVLVLDWGLAKLLARPESDAGAGAGALEPVQTERSSASAHQTQVGAVAGTPAYMPPEQALGDIDRIDARTDVYALGAMLYEVLAGHAPYDGPSAQAVLEKVRAGPPPPLSAANMALLVEPSGPEQASAHGGPPLPPALVAACARAMSRDPADRYESAAALAAELQAWLDGVRRRDDALAVLAKSATRAPEVSELRHRATALRAEAAQRMKGIEPWQSEEDKLVAWELEDRAAVLEKTAELADLEEEQLLQGSLTHLPDLPEAHAALANRYRAEHATAEDQRRDGTRAEALFRQHLAALPDDHADRPGHAAYLKGDGALTLLSDPPGAEVLLYRYELHHRRWLPRLERSLGRTPLQGVPLAMGSYLCELRHPGHAPVSYPVVIGRGEHWDGVPPEGGSPTPIRLPCADELGPEDRYVPAGWFWSGGDDLARSGHPRRRVWVEAHVFRRFPVTNAQYLAFLDDLVAQGRVDEALRHAPRERGATARDQGAVIYAFDGARFSLRPDADGDVWEPAWPVVMVDWHGARAFAAWEAARSGQAWDLPGELAWEKAARGVDGRAFPWGHWLDPSWACMMNSHAGRRLPAVIDRFPVDESPYGVRGMCGNVSDWCLDPFSPEGPAVRDGRATLPEDATAGHDTTRRAYRGGAWFGSEAGARLASRNGVDAIFRNDYLGLRLARRAPA